MEHPILFSSEMVKDVLDGRKTQARRIVTERDCWRNGLKKKYTNVSLENAYPVSTKEYLRVPFRHKEDNNIDWKECGAYRVDPKWEPGDRLWCRETIRYNPEHQNYYYSADSKGVGIKIYAQIRALSDEPKKVITSIHMPKWACRLWLEVVSVRVERVQEIDEIGSICEGIRPFGPNKGQVVSSPIPRRQFAHLWDSIHGEGAWERNDWVWVVEFKRIEK
jgi:hypothetical protein